LGLNHKGGTLHNGANFFERCATQPAVVPSTNPKVIDCQMIMNGSDRDRHRVWWLASYTLGTPLMIVTVDLSTAGQEIHRELIALIEPTAKPL
jgi:hypothetical protein